MITKKDAIAIPIRILVAALMCTPVILLSHRTAYAMRVVRVQKPVVRALSNLYDSVTPKWQTVFSEFLNSPTIDVGIITRELERTSGTVPIIKAQELGSAPTDVRRSRAFDRNSAVDFLTELKNPSEGQLINAAMRLGAIDALVAPMMSAEKRAALGLTVAVEFIREKLPADKQRDFDEAKRIAIHEKMQRTINALGEFANGGTVSVILRPTLEIHRSALDEASKITEREQTTLEIHRSALDEASKITEWEQTTLEIHRSALDEASNTTEPEPINLDLKNP